MERTRIKLREANFFRQKAQDADGEEFLYYTSATLSASRSVTFTLQKEHKGDDDFDSWYGEKQSEMASDPLMRVLSELRNHVVKRTLITKVAQQQHEIIDKRPQHPDFVGEPPIDGDTFTRHTLDEIPQDVKSNVPDKIVDDFEDQHGGQPIESWLMVYYSKILKIVNEAEDVVDDN